MHHFIFADKDCTIYRDYPTQNTGKDEILEITKVINSASLSLLDFNVYSRALVNFNITNVSKSIVSGEIAANARFYLNMHICRVDGQDATTTLYVYPVNKSWVQGIGKRYDEKIRTAGASWTASDGAVPTYWSLSGSDYITGSITPATASLWSEEYNFQNSGIYTYELSDMRVDVTNLVYGWLSGSYTNNGFLIKRSDAEETGSKSYGTLQFYSNDTHTIYNPTLEVAWDDSSYATSSTATESVATDLFLYTRDMQGEYNNREDVRIRVGARKRFPTKTYASSNPYALNYYLPTSSYYSLVDGNTMETLIPFDTGSTKISSNANGPYFDLWMSGLHPERFYQLRIKIVSASVERVFDMPSTFKVTR